MSSITSQPIDLIPQLRAELSGRVITPDDADYDAARGVFIGGIDRRPAVIVRPTTATEVAHVVCVARETGMELAVRSGGHGGAGHGISEGGIVLDLADLDEIVIDPESRTAWAQTGLTAGRFSAAAAEHGLATGFGDTASVGIGGITLGGGIGFLSRKYGLSIDDLLAAEVVTADGEIRYVDADHHPDLFWAIRGGGGNFGVATRFRFRLHEISAIVGGLLVLPAAAETITAILDAAASAPEELTTIVNVLPAPPMPFIPTGRHGELIIMAQLCYVGPADAGASAIAPFRAIADPIVDLVRPMTYPEILADEHGRGPTAVLRTRFFDAVSHADAEAIVAFLRSSDAPMRAMQLRVLGGAIARVAADATAYAHRDAAIMANVALFYTDPADKLRRRAEVEAFIASLGYGAAGAYVNFLSDDGPAGVARAYPPATRDRLAAIKERYDPTNLFRLNHNIAPKN